MPSRISNSILARYGIALAAVAGATLLRLLLDPLLGTRFPFATLFLAVLLVAWHGGFGPALFAALVGVVVADWALLPPRYEFTITGVENVGGLVLFFVVSTGIALIGGAMRRAQHLAEQHARDAELQREELHVTLHSIGDGVIVTDVRGRITAMNAVAVELTGWPLADALARPLAEVFHIVNETTRAKVVNPVDKVLAEGQIVGLANHTVLVGRSGKELPIDDSAARIRDRDGQLMGVVVVFRDVTASREATQRMRRSEQEFADFFENANVGLHWVGPDGIVLRVNQAELDLLGYTRAEYVGRHIAEFHVDQPVIQDILARLTAGERLENFPARMRAKDGTTRDVRINSSVLWDDGRFVHTRCFTLDVTDRNRAASAQALLASVVESSEDAIVTKTLAGQITSWNAGAERLFGYKAHEAVGRPITLIVPPDRLDEEPAILRRLSRGERIEHFETKRIAKDGRVLDISLSISPVRNAQGEIVGAAKVARDITAYRQAEAAAHAAESRLQLISDNIPALIAYIDRHFRYQLNNHAYEAWFGLKRDEMTGRDVRDVLGDAAFAKLLPHMQRALAGQEVSFEEEIPYKHGGTRWVSGSYVPQLNEQRVVEGFAVLINDITLRKQMEDALRAADRRKDEFLATLAHELRNPLAPLRTSLEILKRSDVEPHVVDESRLTMDRQLSHLQRLVDDLLDISRITRDRLELRKERVELASVLHQAIETCRPLAASARHEIVVDLPHEAIYLDADAVRLAQIFSNLLNNACKYTEAGGRIELAVRRDAGGVVVSVSDNGIGIPAGMLSQVFEMFTQVDRGAERSQSGLGIGLTLVRRLVEMHGGSIAAFSAGPGRGSKFVVRLPVLTDAASAKPGTLPPPSETRAPGRRILVVDDNRDAANMLAMLLKMGGHATHVEHDGLAAVSAAETFRPDVVLLDLGLPKLSGHEAARRIRAAAWGQGMTLVAITGWGQDEDRRKSSEAGFNHHLVKPVSHGHLNELIAELP